MAVLRFHQGQTGQPGQASQPGNPRIKPGRWNEPDSFGMASALFMIATSMVALAGFLWAESVNASLVGTIFMVVGAPFLIFGVMISLVVFVETTWHRFWRVRRHCGRCRFYDAYEGQYTLGCCSIDPRDSVVHRLDSCSYFKYSERAMVRDRFAQQADTLIRVRRHAASQTADGAPGSLDQPPPDS